ncbi:MAG: HAMP domain-containing histidine kinase [Anaerolineaceae bacterium]|nr:HAMP domain-containing histidine kinase [Anaerolineaceae bacterium]
MKQTAIQSKLFWKVFLSYLLILFIFMFVLTVAFQFSTPTSFNHHMDEMNNVMIGDHGNRMGGMMNTMMVEEFFEIFDSAIREALFWAALIAFPASFIVAALISRQMVQPIQLLSTAAQNITQGKYQQRIPTNPDKDENNMDELERLTVNFNQMAGSLEQAENMRKQLIGDVSHELRTPLTTIKGFMEGLIDNVLPADPITFEEVHNEAERLSRLVDDLQKLSFVESNGFQLTKQPIKIEKVMEKIQRQSKPLIVKKDLEFIIDLPNDLLEVFADEDRLEQILLNLLNNAVDHTNNQGKVQISVKANADHIEISVTDDGIGIEEQDIPFLFDRFYRVDRSRSRKDGGGSGIGLTICKQLVQAHGGEIRAISAGTGKGSTFSFTLPR